MFDPKDSQGMKLRDVSVILNPSEGPVETRVVRPLEQLIRTQTQLMMKVFKK
jgi:hypothetical protein